MRATLVILLFAGCTGDKGDKGDPGPMGTMGADGQSIAITTEPPGANCQNGGLKLTSGTIVSYICNGLNGSGSLAVTPEPAGANCTNGGVKIQSSSGTSYVCNGSSTLDDSVSTARA